MGRKPTTPVLTADQAQALYKLAASLRKSAAKELNAFHGSIAIYFEDLAARSCPSLPSPERHGLSRESVDSTRKALAEHNSADAIASAVAPIGTFDHDVLEIIRQDLEAAKCADGEAGAN